MGKHNFSQISLVGKKLTNCDDKLCFIEGKIESGHYDDSQLNGSISNDSVLITNFTQNDKKYIELYKQICRDKPVKVVVNMRDNPEYCSETTKLISS